MSNTIELRTIAALLGERFWVPAYQRRYRWTEHQVNDLLDDIYNFTLQENKQTDAFYCLQPIIVKERDEDDKKMWEVVDGQQRLTTIKILLTYLKKTDVKNYPTQVCSLAYETRSDTATFLDNITESVKNIDQNYILKTYKVITDWFTKGCERAKQAILNTLVTEEHPVKVIWYQIADAENPIETFMRINLGKIPLTNSELIKALFLQSGNFGENSEAAKLRQLEIATQWDMIENALQNDYFWYFLSKETPKSARIEFIFDLLCQQAVKKDSSLKEIIGKDEFKTFRYFYNLFDKDKTYDAIKREWSRIIDCFNTFQDWFTDAEQYHYIGFLINVKDDISTILSKRDAAETKKDFVQSLKTLIGKYPLDNLVFPNDRRRIMEVLLLFNVEYVVALQRTRTFFEYKFPFKEFLLVEWDVEHIDSSTENSLAKLEAQIIWLKDVEQDFKTELSTNLDLSNKIQIFIEKGGDNFANLYNEIIKFLKDDDDVIDDKTKNSIGNLALLDLGTNRGYGNALFRTKRRIIIEKDKTGTFIPLCTKNVFLKYFDSIGTSRTKWTEDDIKNYKNAIQTTLEDFIK